MSASPPMDVAAYLKAKTTPQTEGYRGQLEPGNIDLSSRPIVKNSDGTISTVRSFSTNIDGREVLLPTVTDDGKIVSEKEAVQRFFKTHKHLGIFDTPENATTAAKAIHEDQARRYLKPAQGSAAPPMDPAKYLEEKTGQPAEPKGFLQEFQALPGSGFVTGPIKAAGKVAGFAGDVAQSLSTGPINAAAQAIQDNGIGPQTILPLLKNEAQSAANPFIPGQSPIQSTETSLARSGMPNTPSEKTHRVPGFVMKSYAQSGSYGLKPQDAGKYENGKFYPLDVHYEGAAKSLGMAADALAPVWGAGALAKGAKLATKEIAGKLAPMFEKGAERIQQTVLKPRAGDWNAGANIENIGKYKLQGNVDDVIQNADTQIKEASAALRRAISEGQDGGATVDLSGAIDKAKTRLQKEGGADLVDAMGPAFAKFRRWANIESERGGAELGKADLLSAQEFKQMMGSHGAWEKTAAAKNMGISEGERYQSRAAQAVYLELKNAIESSAPDGVKDLNKTLSDLIPIRNAAVYRKIVSDRNNPIGLSDMMSAMTAVGNGPAGAAMLAATKFTKSGMGARTMYSVANDLKRLSGAIDEREAVFYINKLKKEKMKEQEIADALQEIRRPKEDLNTNSPRKTPGRRSLSEPLKFGKPQAGKKFDPLDLLTQSGEGSGAPGVEGMAPAEMAAQKEAARKAFNEDFIRKSRGK